MSTRHAPNGAPLHDNRYMSAPEFVELRGISGTAVAAKAEFISLKSERALLFFIQSLSIKQNGTKQLAREIVEMFPERIGTPSMRKFGTKPGQIYNTRQVKIVRAEVGMERFANGVPDNKIEEVLADVPVHSPWPLKGEHEPLSDEIESRHWQGCSYKEAKARHAEENREIIETAAKHPTCYPAAVFFERCRDSILEALPDLLRELCINPCIELRTSGEKLADIDREELLESNPQLKGETFGRPRLRYFDDILGALFEFKRRYEERDRAPFTMTSRARMVFEALDYGLKSQRMVLIQGDSGLGKSEAVKAWCDMHLGEARYVQLMGINGRRAFFGTVAKACGVGSTAGLSPEKIQARVENYLKTTAL